MVDVLGQRMPPDARLGTVSVPYASPSSLVLLRVECLVHAGDPHVFQARPLLLSICLGK